MELQTYAKIGIVVGIGAIVLLSSFYIIFSYSQNMDTISMLFIDTDKIKSELKSTDSFKLMIEKYPDVFIEEHNSRHNIGFELVAFSPVGTEIRYTSHYDFWDDRIQESAHCNVRDHQLQKELGISEKYIEEYENNSSPIPMYFFTNGNSRDDSTLQFIKYTNCLEVGLGEDTKAPEIITPEYGDFPTYTISIPEGSSVPGCEEIAHCFEPEEITIKVGDIIEWKNYDDSIHTVTSGDTIVGPTGLFDSGVAEPDATFALKFNTPGEYPYFCMIHPWQTGTITVTE
jgi:plastocyanin